MIRGRAWRRAMACLLVATLAVSACASSTKPAPSLGGEEVSCPDGSSNAGATIRTVNCSTVVQFDGKELSASLNVREIAGAGIQHADRALRQVSEAAHDAQIQFTQTCELFNACNLTTTEYRQRLDEAQSHFRRIREQVALLEAAKGNPEVLRGAFSSLYATTVPPAQARKSTLGLELTVQSRSKGGGVRVVRPGETLHSGDPLVLGVRTSLPAHVYVFQRNPDDSLDVLFPNEVITTMTNPLPAEQLVRIPPSGQVFTLDDSNIGRETVFIAASKTPLSDLDAALRTAGSAGGRTEQVKAAMTDLFAQGRPECEGTRALEVTTDGACSETSRGLSPTTSSSGTDDFFTNEASVQVVAVPGDDVVIQTFSFEHAK